MPVVCILIDYIAAKLILRYFDLSMGKRPAEELYDLVKDPSCMANLAEKTEFEPVKRKLWEEMEVLFTLLAERYERGSVLITSNLPFSKWESIFKDAMTTAAAIDRLVHHSVILELNLPSYRVEQAKKSKAAGPGEVPPLAQA